MSMENERICVKCNKVMHDNEAFCTNCGTISGTIKKGTILIKANNVMLVGLSLILLGIGLVVVIIVVLLIKGINLGSMVGALFALGLIPIIIGSTIITKWREYINKRKAELVNDISTIYCKHCYTIVDVESKYCCFCGSKIK